MIFQCLFHVLFYHVWSNIFCCSRGTKNGTLLSASCVRGRINCGVFARMLLHILWLKSSVWACCGRLSPRLKSKRWVAGDIMLGVLSPSKVSLSAVTERMQYGPISLIVVSRTIQSYVYHGLLGLTVGGPHSAAVQVGSRLQHEWKALVISISAASGD